MGKRSSLQSDGRRASSKSTKHEPWPCQRGLRQARRTSSVNLAVFGLGLRLPFAPSSSEPSSEPRAADLRFLAAFFCVGLGAGASESSESRARRLRGGCTGQSRSVTGCGRAIVRGDGEWTRRSVDAGPRGRVAPVASRGSRKRRLSRVDESESRVGCSAAARVDSLRPSPLQSSESARESWTSSALHRLRLSTATRKSARARSPHFLCRAAGAEDPSTLRLGRRSLPAPRSRAAGYIVGESLI